MTVAFRLENIERRFGTVKALDGLSIAVHQGEVYGFLGRNGAGKTTALRVLMGVIADSRLRGHEIIEWE